MNEKEFLKIEKGKRITNLNYKISFFLKIPYNCEPDTENIRKCLGV